MLVVGDVNDDDMGFVGERLRERGAEITRLDRDRLPPYADAGTARLVLLLGSARSGHSQEHAEVVEIESAFVRSALDDGVPVLGICYGSQLLAHALGGQILASPQPEIAVTRIESYDARLCPPGPWVLLHSDTFEPPAGARVLGRTPGGCQGFTDESRAARAMAWQFHPEVKPLELSGWLDKLEVWVESNGGDAERVREEAFARGDQLRAQAYQLTDDALAWLLAR